MALAGRATPGVEHSRRARLAVLVAAAVLYVSGTIGSNIGPAWVDEHPATLLVLSSRNRNLFLSVPFIDPLPYALIGFTRLFVVAVVLYLVGRWFGDRAVSWTERQVGELPALYRWFERGLDRAGWAFVVLMPGSNLVCLMAGHRRMRERRFLAALVLGIVAKLVVLWVGGKVFEDQIRSLLDWIEGYQWWIVGGLFALSFLQSLRRASKNPPRPILDAVAADEPPPVEGTAGTAGTGGTSTASTADEP